MFRASRYPELRRRGFTLVEILVVLAIIAILMALAGWAVFATVGSQQSRNTKSTMKVLKDILNKHWQYVIDEADKEAPSPAVLGLANGDNQRAKVIWRKVRLMEAFPTTYAEIQAPWVYTSGAIPPGQYRYVPDYQAKIKLKAAVNPATESSACLRVALSARRTGTVLSDDLIKFAVKDTDGDGIAELVDGWNNAMVFYRFAWNNPLLQATKPVGGKLKFADPTDPDGMLLTPVWYSSPGRLTFESFIHPVTNPYPWGAKVPPPPTGNFVAPVIVSAGPDGTKLGLPAALGLNVAKGYLTPDMSIVNPAANDNIYSFQLTGN